MSSNVKYEDLTTDKARIEYMRERLHTDDRWCVKGLLTIFEYQTADEQRTEQTREHNGVGFTGVDGELLSSYAKQVIGRGGSNLIKQKDFTILRVLSKKQAAILKNKMPKYARQLVRVSKHKVK